MDKPYKYEEIEEHFQEWLSDQEGEWIEDNIDDLHHHAFNTDYYIIGTQKAIEWMGSKSWDIMNFVRSYEVDNFGELHTDLSNPERLVNMYTYIIGEQIVNEFVTLREEAA